MFDSSDGEWKRTAAVGESDPQFRESLEGTVRQQWNFSPPGAIREVEEYQVELSNVTVLELVIKPNIGGGLTIASLKNLRLS